MRQIGVSYSGFVDESYTLLSLFDDVEQIEKDTERDHYMSAQEALEYGLIDGIMDKRM